MIINPKVIAGEGIVSNIENPEEQIQQHGIDITIKSISQLNCSGTNILTKKERKHVQREKVEGKLLNEGVYDILFNEEVNIPNGMCANIHTRSTVNRGGNVVTSGLYDAGYHGALGAVFHVKIPILLEEGVRIAQIVFSSAEKGSLYDGVYNEKTVV